MKCEVCAKNLRVQESVLLPCSCFICLCQECARQQLRDGPLTYSSPIECPSCKISVTSELRIIEGVENALQAEDKLVRRAMARTKTEHSSAGVITNFVKLKTCYNRLLKDENPDAELDGGREPLGERNGENHARDVAVARYRMLISQVMLRHLPKFVDPMALITFTNNPFVELPTLESDAARQVTNEESVAGNSSSHFPRGCVCMCSNDIKPGCSVMRICSCKNVLCRSCAIHILCLRQAETFHAGLKCPTCRKCSPNVVKNVPFLSECEDALVRSAEAYLTSLVFMRGKAKAETDEAFTLRSKAFYRDAVRLYWILGFKSINEKEEDLDRLTLNQLRFEVARLEESRLNTCGIAHTYDLLGEQARTLSGDVPIGFLSTVELQPCVFFERLVLRHEAPTESNAEATAERNRNLLATIARWHRASREVPHLTAVDKIVLTAMYVQRDPADDTQPYTFTLYEEVIEAVRALLYKRGELKRPLIEQALKRLSPELLTKDTLLKLYNLGLLLHVSRLPSGGADAVLTELSGDKNEPIPVRCKTVIAHLIYKCTSSSSCTQARWRAVNILTAKGPSCADGRLTTLLDPGLLKLATSDCYVRTPPLDPLTASSPALTKLAYPTGDERYGELRGTLAPRADAQPPSSSGAAAGAQRDGSGTATYSSAAPLVAAVKTIHARFSGEPVGTGADGSDSDYSGGNASAPSARGTENTQGRGLKRPCEAAGSSSVDSNKAVRVASSSVRSAPPSTVRTADSSDGSATAAVANATAASEQFIPVRTAGSSAVAVPAPGTAGVIAGNTVLRPWEIVAIASQEGAAAARAAVTSSAPAAMATQRPPRTITIESDNQSRVLPAQAAGQPTAQRKANTETTPRPAEKAAARASQQQSYVQEVLDSSDSSSTSESDPELRQLLSHKPSKGRLSGLLTTSDAVAPFATAAAASVMSRLDAGKSRAKAATVVNLTDIVDSDDDGELTPVPRSAPATSARTASMGMEVTPLAGAGAGRNAVPGGAAANAQQEVLRRLIHEQLPTLRKAIVDKEEAARGLRQENTQLTAQLLETQEALQRVRGDCDTHANTIEGLRAQLRASDEAHATTQSALDKCRAALEEANKSSTSFADTTSKRDAEVAQLRREAKASVEQTASLRKSRDDMDTNNKKLQNTVNQLKHSSSKAQEDFKILRGRLDKADLDLSQKDSQVTTLSSTVSSLRAENDKLKAELAVRAALSNQTQHMAEENQRLQREVVTLQSDCRNYHSKWQLQVEENARGRKEWLTATEANQELLITKQEQEEEIAHLKRKLKQRKAADAKAADELLNELKHSGGTE
jgi:hypothetical protein